MGILGKPTGIFDLKNSDKYVGSYISRDDIKEILNVTDEDLQTIKFERLKDIEVID